jgi:hypothetical protein
MRQMRNSYKILVGKSEGKTQLGRPRCRWEDNIRMALRQMGFGFHESGEFFSYLRVY